jgi:hypothetical protein
MRARRRGRAYRRRNERAVRVIGFVRWALFGIVVLMML